MTGRELIIYILQNKLEDEEILVDGIFVGFMDGKQAAAKFDVGVETVAVWYKLGMLPGVKLGDSVYFMKDVQDPRKDQK